MVIKVTDLNNFAITSGGIGDALMRSAAALAQAGNSIDESIALITTANTVVQNVETVGTALKTISLRIGKTKTELEELGEDTYGALDNVSDYRKKILAATSQTSAPVDIMNANQTAYKSTYEILKELADVWDELDQAAQNSILYNLSGSRGVNVLSAILNDFSTAESVLETATKAQGSALEENEKYLDSIQGKLDKLTASFQALSNDILSSGLVKMFVDLANAITKGADSFVKFTGVLPILTSVGAGLAKLKGFSLSDLKGSGFGGIKNAPSLREYSTAKAMFSGSGFDSLTYKGEEGKSALLEAIDGTATLGDSFKQLLKDEAAAGKTGEESLARVRVAIDKLEGGSKLKAFGSALGTAFKGFAIATAASATINLLAKGFDLWYNKAEYAKKGIEELQDEIEEMRRELANIDDVGKTRDLTEAEKKRAEHLRESLSYEQAIVEAKQQQLNLENLTASNNNPFKKNSYEKFQDLQFDSQYWGGITNGALDGASGETIQGAHNYLSSQYTELSKLLTEYDAAYNSATDSVQRGIYSGYIVKIEAMQNSLKDNMRILEETGEVSIRVTEEAKKVLSGLSDEARSWNYVLYDTGAEVGEINEKIDEAQSAFSTLNDAILEYNAQGAYSIDTLQALSNLDDRYLDFLIDENGQLRLNTQAVRDLQEARVNELRIKIVRESISSIQSLTDERAATDWLANQTAALATTQLDAARSTLALEAALALSRGGEDMAAAVNKIIQRTNLLMKAVNDLGTANGKSSSTTKALADAQNKLKKRTEDNNKALKARGKAMENALEAQKKDLQAQQKALDKQKDALDDQKDALEDQIKELDKKYDEEQKEFELQKRIVAWQQAQASKTVRVYSHENGWQWMADPTAERDARNSVEEYRRELSHESEKQGLQDQVDDIEKQKEALDDQKDAIQDQIDKIDELKNELQESINLIGTTLEDYEQDLAFAAEVTNMNFDRMKRRVEDFGKTVVDTLAPASAYESGDAGGLSSGAGFQVGGAKDKIDPATAILETARAAGVSESAIRQLSDAYLSGTVDLETLKTAVEKLTTVQLENAAGADLTKEGFKKLTEYANDNGLSIDGLNKLYEKGILTNKDYVKIVDEAIETQKNGGDGARYINEQVQEYLETTGWSIEELNSLLGENVTTIEDLCKQSAEIISGYRRTTVLDSKRAAEEWITGVVSPIESALNRLISKAQEASSALSNIPDASSVGTTTKKTTSSGKTTRTYVVKHNGGLVEGITPTANVSDEFKKFMMSLDSNEVPAILQAGEWVLTKAQQKQIIDSNNALLGLRSRQNTGSVVFNGDIVISDPIGDVPSLSRAIIEKLPNQILVDMNKN